MPLGEHALPVRSDDEAEVKMTIRSRALGQVLDRERHARIGDVENRARAAFIVPLPGDGEADVDLVLMVGDQKVDRLAEHRAAEILNRHPRHFDRAGAGQIGIRAGLVVHNSDREGARGARGTKRRRSDSQKAGEAEQNAYGENSPDHGEAPQQ